MNKTKSWVFFVIGALIFAGGIWGFAHGAKMLETGPKVAWMVGSLVVLVLTVFAAVKLNAKKD